ncbi:MAG: prephenate dehydrogenase [Holophagales bacterium]|nr:prephenate dehydrogenase [Holophagales bacterium]MYG30507.1 prephenate dehydrogenase [Holophagales bacterium]MYI81553.1 prephenate dehydrogenase [Holophagales bacterium]
MQDCWARTIGIVGLGSFGRFLVRHLGARFDLQVWDRRDLSTEAAALGARWTGLDACAGCDIVIPAVPVQDLDGLIADLAPRLTPDTLVVDVASVKVKPLRILEQRLPRQVQFLGTHPMFGPQSGRGGIRGLKVVLCLPERPVDNERVQAVRAFLESDLELQVLEMSAEEHDSEMAYIQGLTHWMAKALREIHVPDPALGTVAYRHMMKIEENLRDDSDDLFLTIARENPFAADARRELRERLREIEKAIERD